MVSPLASFKTAATRSVKSLRLGMVSLHALSLSYFRKQLPGDVAWRSLTRKRKSLACIAGDAFPGCGRQIVAALVVTELIGASILYVILLGSSIASIASYMNVPGATIPACMAIFGYAILPLLLFPSMRVVAWFSVIAVVGLMVSLTSVLVGSGIHMAQDGGKAFWGILSNPEPQMVPVSLGIILLSFCVHPVLPGIEGAMKHPHMFPRMLGMTFTGAVIMKVS